MTQVSFFIVLVSTLAVNANIETNRKITDVYAKAYLQQKNPSKAIELLQAHLVEDQQDAGMWSLLGKAYLQTSKSDQAVAAFENAVKYASADEAPVLNYSLAEAQARAGKIEDAKKSLKLAAEEPNNQTSVSRALNELSVGKSISELRPEKSNRWKAKTSVNTSYDDNVLLFSESLATTRRTDTASVGIAPNIDFKREKPYNEGVITLSPSLSGQFYTNENAKFYDSLNLVVGLEYSKNSAGWLGLKHSFDNSAKIANQNSKKFEFYNFENTIKWSGLKELNANQQITFSQDIRYQQYKPDSTALAADNRNGVALKPQVNWQGSSAGYNFTAGLGYEHLFAQGNNYISNTTSLPLSVQTELPKNLTGKLAFAYSSIQYPKSTTERKDGNFSTSASLSKKFGKTTAVSVDLGYTKNTSNLENAVYSKNSIGIKVISEIF